MTGQPGDRQAQRPGRLHAGTSGFAYPSWIPRFYAPGRASRKLLTAYAARLPAVELDDTASRRPADETVARWMRETPDHFRFCPRAQRSAIRRAWTPDGAAGSMAWLAASLSGFGDRLGALLLAAPATLERDDAALIRVLEARPPELPVALLLPHPSWQDDSVHELLHAYGVASVATDRDDHDEPDLRRIGPFLYLRLRRSHYDEAAVDRWARRLEPFLADGLDAFVFFRADEQGGAALCAEALLQRLAAAGSSGG